VTFASLAAWLGRASHPQTTTEPATEWMRTAWHVLERQWPWSAVAVALAIVVIVTVALQRRPAGEAGAPGPLWTLVPLALLAGGIVTATIGPRHPRGITDGPENPGELRVSVVGHQWWWEIRYPDLGVVTATDLHVPVRARILTTLETADVAHSLWVPAMGPRQDVLPGPVEPGRALRRRSFEFTPDREGVYPGQCAEACGLSHAQMHVRVVVESDAVFTAWVAAQRAPRAMPDSLRGGALREGEQVFLSHACRGCHTVRGLSDGPGGPDLTHFASRGTIAGGMLPRTDENVARWILHANEMKPGAGMPGFPVPPHQLEPLVAWLQSLR
jgi:cytochrome c oxidase subunit 2